MCGKLHGQESFEQIHFSLSLPFIKSINMMVKVFMLHMHISFENIYYICIKHYILIACLWLCVCVCDCVLCYVLSALTSLRVEIIVRIVAHFLSPFQHFVCSSRPKAGFEHFQWAKGLRGLSFSGIVITLYSTLYDELNAYGILGYNRCYINTLKLFV